MSELNETHDPELSSWVSSANTPGHDFPLQNLPFAVFRRKGTDEAWRGGVAIGDDIVDLAACVVAGHLKGMALEAARAASGDALNALMALGPGAASALRLALSRALRTGADRVLADCLVPQAGAEFALPARIGDYTDFYTSVHHATRVGALFRPDAPLLPNYKWVPIGYHGRSSSIGVSGQAVRRPTGQVLPAGAQAPVVAPSARLDYELELGVFVGPGNALGEPIGLDEAEAHVFGMCLLNDWSARDVQGWEYQPLGPFLAKNFATTVSPWIVTMEALAPFRLPWSRPDTDPEPLPYLDSPAHRTRAAIDIRVSAALQTPAMRARGEAPARLSESSFRHAYWSVAQMVAHHTVNGCNLQPGDLLGTGTQSGPDETESGSLVELTRGGRQPLTLPDGEQRTFLEDGDQVTFSGWCERPGARRIGFGRVDGTVLPARQAGPR
ncbi:fumarylacetoacetase [Rhizobacter sp. LjRoot28]|jgi:fumarylacetoacetase|uniref:fumarylacetoacetase n=1 Tax=Rhizobacter sp. LjRoot28 TaxID=3342309 RepID=UPI003ECC785D